jgi:hypothetical protein
MSNTDARLWHPWLRINRVVCVMLGLRAVDHLVRVVSLN